MKSLTVNWNKILERFYQFVKKYITKISILSFVNSNSLYSRFAKGVMWSFIGAVISQGLTLLASIPVARRLGAEVYGELGIIQSTLAVFAIFAGTSLGLTATKHVAELAKTEPKRAGKLIGLTYETALIAGGLFSIILAIGAKNISITVLNAPQLTVALRIAAVVLFLNSINGAQTGILAGLQAFQKIAQVNTIRGLVTFPIILIGVWLWGLNGAMIAYAVAAGIGLIVNQRMLKEEIYKNNLVINYRESWHEWKVLLRFTIPAILSGSVVTPVTWWANVILVNQNNGYIQMGIFNATNQWRIALAFLPGVLAQPTLPLLADLYGTRAFVQYRKLLFLNLNIVIISVLIPAIGISIAAPWIIDAYGINFSSGALILRIMLLTTVLSSSIGVIGSAISSIGKMWQGFIINIIWAFAFIGYFSSQNHDALRLALAYLVSYLVHLFTVSGYTFFVLRKHFSQID